jgi:RNA-binding protein
VTQILTGKQRRFLRAAAHAQKPLVQIGHAGLTPGVSKAIDQALETHELVKIRVLAEAGADAEELVEPIEGATRSSVVQVIGRTLLVYRRRKKDPKITLPAAGRTRGEP